MEPDEITDRRERYRKVAALIDEWSNEESGYDEEAWPRLKASIEENRLSYRKRFEDEPCKTIPPSE